MIDYDDYQQQYSLVNQDYPTYITSALHSLSITIPNIHNLQAVRIHHRFYHISAMSKISKAAFEGLAKKIRENSETLKNLTFADNQTSKTAVKTKDLRFDVHRNTRDPTMATGIIQANSQAEDRTVQNFIKGKTGGHKGTHQVIGEKITFGLGENFKADDVASAVENTE
ncbi:hypothetical protein BO82DRAFT_312507 [Aspergillus uvarum CBS 121591]|uniref:Uncharacterized protein n=1 Tax=Aspergillus uvarum CBS 121591 TaxID=1448315 RepID=A0A319CAF9_9EURO|nr:hypothetical protein BO82DRAFT_312507 [Aspergillus uvarum CBS 121591]PYH80597.1 hypothetical protein BO82DRAFT_312507 [Aspergillus uvarum CBS 121591]